MPQAPDAAKKSRDLIKAVDREWTSALIQDTEVIRAALEGVRLTQGLLDEVGCASSLYPRLFELFELLNGINAQEVAEDQRLRNICTLWDAQKAHLYECIKAFEAGKEG